MFTQLFHSTPNHTGFNLNMTLLVIHFFSYLAENTRVPLRLKYLNFSVLADSECKQT